MVCIGNSGSRDNRKLIFLSVRACHRDENRCGQVRREPEDDLEKTDSFFRSHRSFIINISKIKKVDKKEFVIVMNNDEQAYLAQDKKQALIDKLER